MNDLHLYALILNLAYVIFEDKFAVNMFNIMIFLILYLAYVIFLGKFLPASIAYVKF